MQIAAKIDQNQTVSISKPDFEVGDNRFLSHGTHEIYVANECVGNALVSLYDFQSAATLKVARNWLSRPNSYLAQYKKYLFVPESMLAKLPPDTEVSGNGSGKLLIIDELLVNPGYESGKFETSTLNEMVDAYSQLCEGILLPKWQSLGRRLGMGAEEQLRYFADMGFLAIDGAMMIRTG